MDMKQVVLIVLAILAIVYILYNTVDVKGIDLEKGLQFIEGKGINEPFIAGASINQGIGKYSNIELRYPYQNNWRNNSQNMALLKQPIYAPQGTPFPLKSSDSMQPVYPTMGPRIDGEPDSPQMLSMLAFNQAKPECCPSTFSTSTGCVCLTSKQSDWLSLRGGNNGFNSDF
jgi:hypothetical protein